MVFTIMADGTAIIDGIITSIDTIPDADYGAYTVYFDGPNGPSSFDDDYIGFADFRGATIVIVCPD